MMSRGGFAIVALLCAACPVEPGPPPPPVGDDDDDDDDDDPKVDLTPLAFDPERVVEVEIDIDPAEWDALRDESRSVTDLFAPNCVDQPFPSPFQDHGPATVTLDGERFDDVFLKKKGFLGSLSTSKPGLKVDLDDVVDQEWNDLDKLTLNNVPQDPSFLHTCLAYLVFNAAGVPAPRCNFAHVVVNGEDLGLYVHVETVKKRFVRDHFGSDEGNLYEGTLSDFTPEWLATFQRETNEDEPGAPEAVAIAEALTVGDDELIATLEDAVDLDQFLAFWAVEVLVGHWDGYSGNQNNFFLYGDPATGKAHFIPWGADATMLPSILGYQGGPQPKSVAAYGFLARRLYNHPEGRARYQAKLRELLDSVWDETSLQDEIARMDALIEPVLRDDDERANQEAQLAPMLAFINARRAEVVSELDALAAAPQDWVEPFRLPFCFDNAGTVTATFSTTFGTWPTDNTFATGTGTYGGTLAGAPLSTSQVGSAAGVDVNVPDGSQSVVVSVQILDDGRTFFYVLVIDTLDIAVGTFPVDDVVVQLILFEALGDGSVVNRGRAYDGELVLEQASTTPGAPFVGDVVGEFVQIGF